jgi:hypothetical protein
MRKPTEQELAVIEAGLEARSEMYVAAVEAYREGVIDALVDFAMEFVPGAASIRLSADVDWRWCFDAWLDGDGEEIEVDFGVWEDYIDEVVLSSSRLSELDDFHRASYGYVHVADREFVDVDLAGWTQMKAARQG